MLRPKLKCLMSVVLLLLFSTAGFAGDKSKVKQLTPTVTGSTGLFKIALPDTLRQGEFSIAFHSFSVNREPGDLNFTVFPVSLTFGLHDRIEIFASFEAHKRVDADGYRVGGTSLLSGLSPAVLSSGLIGYYNDAPFINTGFGSGIGDLWVGAKFNLLSERRGAKFGLAVQPAGRFHVSDSPSHQLRGLTSGGDDFQLDLLASKNLPQGGTLALSGGIMLAEDVSKVTRQNSFTWGVGLDYPLRSDVVHGLLEVDGQSFVGERGGPLTPDRLVNPNNPVDLYAGLRAFPTKWLELGGGYLANIGTTIDQQRAGVRPTNRNGWIAQLSLQRKINEPPTIQCQPENNSVVEGQKVSIRATIDDPDDDELSVTWKASGGKVSGDQTAVFDSTGLTPGNYRVSADVSDGENVATCSVDIAVEKNKMPPTIQCQPGTASVTEGQSVTLRAQASDPNNDALNFTWTIDGQSVSNNRPDLEFGTVGRSVGRHTVKVTATDVDGMTADCSFEVTVNRRPNRNPTVTLTLDKTEVFAGDTVMATAQASDPDNDPLTYTWSVDGQSRSETGSEIQINTSGMAGGSHSVSVTVRDDRGGSASDTKSFAVTEKIVIQIDKIRPDNVAKARLDEIALKLQQDPRLRVRITGYTDSRGSEKANERVGLRRAEAIKNYLVSQHKIDETRIETKSGGEANPLADNSTRDGRKQNRRVEIELYVP